MFFMVFRIPVFAGMTSCLRKRASGKFSAKILKAKMENSKAKKVRVYLDTSVYNRPFDDQSQPRMLVGLNILIKK